MKTWHPDAWKRHCTLTISATRYGCEGDWYFYVNNSQTTFLNVCTAREFTLSLTEQQQLALEAGNQTIDTLDFLQGKLHTYYVAGGLYDDVFEIVGPTGRFPYVWTDPLPIMTHTEHHASIYQLGDDGKTLTLHRRGQQRDHDPKHHTLTDQQAQSVAKWKYKT